MLLRPIGTLILNPQRADADDELSGAFAASPEKTSTIPALSMVPIETRPTFTARYKDAMTDNRFLKRLRKKAKKGLRGWPLATIAF
jgi:hypothetical protein